MPCSFRAVQVTQAAGWSPIPAASSLPRGIPSTSVASVPPGEGRAGMAPGEVPSCWLNPEGIDCTSRLY